MFVCSAPQDPDSVTHPLSLPPDHLVKQKLSPPGQWRRPDDRRQVQHVNAPGTAEERKGSQPHPPMGSTIRRLDEVVAPMYGCSNGNDNDEEIESTVYTVYVQNLSCSRTGKSSVRIYLCSVYFIYLCEEVLLYWQRFSYNLCLFNSYMLVQNYCCTGQN